MTATAFLTIKIRTTTTTTFPMMWTIARALITPIKPTLTATVKVMRAIRTTTVTMSPMT